MSTKDKLPVLSIVIPCYNEQEVLPISLPYILGIIDSLVAEGLVDKGSFVLCSNDGSTDSTWEVLSDWHAKDPRVKAISLAHNRGHQFALLAGLMTAKDICDITVSIDADLQDAPEAIVDMVKAYHDGAEIVYGVRSSRKTDTWFKRTTAHAFYRLQKGFGLDTVYDHADFRLMDKRALEILSEYEERNLFLRGIIPQIGLKTAIVKYERRERQAGESKYPLGKMLSFSIDGITSFSTQPIRHIFILGVIFLIIDIAMVMYVLLSYFRGEVIPGWSSLMLSVWFLGSIILVGIGIIGEYIGKIYKEVKQRPRYNISDHLL